MTESRGAESLIKYESEIEMAQNYEEYQKSKKLALVPHESKPSPEDILNAIIPPREWVDGHKLFVQYVSHSLVSRDDTKRLETLLAERLKDRQAREKGICPIREELFSQCFDELIRQVTIDCPERGLLLMRVRDELKMTIAAYQTLYQSSVVFGMRKQLKAEEGMDELNDEIRKLEAKKFKLEEKRIELNSKRDSVEKKIKERQQIEDARMKEELEFLKYQAQNLDTFLSTIRFEK
jgi:dynein light intermediate chain